MLLAQNNHVPQNQTFGFQTEFGFVRQSVRIQTNCQTGSEWDSDNCLAGPLNSKVLQSGGNTVILDIGALRSGQTLTTEFISY